MKHTLIIFALLTATIQTFAQSPRIKLNQITKDSLSGSVLISSPTDSGMVYSRDLFISYGADTVLILGGDTLAATSSIISSVLSDGVTITGDGTTGSELTVDTATVIATKQDLDLYYLDSNPDGYTSNTGTVTSVGGTGTVNGISLSGTVTSSGNLTLGGTLSGVDLSSQVTGTLPIANGGTGSATQNFVDLSSAQTVGGAKTFTSALTQSGGDVNFDSGTLFVDAANNRVGIGQTQTLSGGELTIRGGLHLIDPDTTLFSENVIYSYPTTQTTAGANASTLTFFAAGPGSTAESQGPYFTLRGNNFNLFSNEKGLIGLFSGAGTTDVGYNGKVWLFGDNGIILQTSTGEAIKIEKDGGIIIPSLLNASTGNTMYYNTTSDEISYSSSSIRFKEEIEDLPIGLNELMDLKPSRYTYIPDGQKDYGYIAEQVYDIGLTEFVTFNESGQIEGLKDKYFMVLHTKAIQEQQTIIEQQATEIETLKTEIQLILNEIEQIKNN